MQEVLRTCCSAQATWSLWELLLQPAPCISVHRRRTRKLWSSPSRAAWTSASLELIAFRFSLQLFQDKSTIGQTWPPLASGPAIMVTRPPVESPPGQLLCAWSERVITTTSFQLFAVFSLKNLSSEGRCRTSQIILWISSAEIIFPCFTSSESKTLQRPQSNGWVWIASHCQLPSAHRQEASSEEDSFACSLQRRSGAKFTSWSMSM